MISRPRLFLNKYQSRDFRSLNILLAVYKRKGGGGGGGGGDALAVLWCTGTQGRAAINHRPSWKNLYHDSPGTKNTWRDTETAGGGGGGGGCQIVTLACIVSNDIFYHVQSDRPDRPCLLSTLLPSNNGHSTVFVLASFTWSYLKIPACEWFPFNTRAFLVNKQAEIANNQFKSLIDQVRWCRGPSLRWCSPDTALSPVQITPTWTCSNQPEWSSSDCKICPTSFLAY